MIPQPLGRIAITDLHELNVPEQGLAGFCSNVQKELARDSFKVRLWSQKEFLEKLFRYYDAFLGEIRLVSPEEGVDCGG